MAATTLMFKTRPCGCKGLRSCKICEEKYGAWNVQQQQLFSKEKGYVFCPYCKQLWPGWEMPEYTTHPDHHGKSMSFTGIELILDFVSKPEEEVLLKKLDEVPWDASQSGRYKQNYGPKCNFKKRKVKSAIFSGYPLFTKFIHDRFKTVELLTEFYVAEQCSLDYTEDRGSSIDPHIDDCWIWGERIPTLNLLSDSVLTLTKYRGPAEKYNLQDSLDYPCIVRSDGSIKSFQTLTDEYSEIQNSKCDKNQEEEHDDRKKEMLSNIYVNNSEELPDIIRIPLPPRSLVILYGAARYIYEHSILREDICDRRICITYRELTPPFMVDEQKKDIGKQILESSSKYWNTLHVE